MVQADSTHFQPDHQYLQDAFTQAWVEKQVRDRIDDYLKKLRGVVGFVILMASAVLGVLGYQLVDLRKELVEKTAQASEDVQAAGTNVKASGELLTQANGLSKSTSATVKSTIELLRENVNQASSSTNSLSATLSSLRGQEREIAAAQGTLAKEALGFKDQQDVMTKALEEQRKQNEITAADALGRLQAVQKGQEKVEGIAGDLQQVQEIYSDLLEQRQVEYAFLRSNDSRILDLYSVVRRDQGPNVRHVRRVKILVSVGVIQDRNDLTVSVLDDGTNSPGATRTYNQLRQSETPIIIGGTQFVFRVEFVYHSKVANDFVVLKIQPGDSSRGQ